MFNRLIASIARRISASEIVPIPSIDGSSISILMFSAVHDRKDDQVAFFLKLRASLGPGSNPFVITLTHSVDTHYLLKDVYSEKSLGDSIYAYLTEALYNVFFAPMHGDLFGSNRIIKFSPKETIDTDRSNMISKLFIDRGGDQTEFREVLKHLIDAKCRPDINRLVVSLRSEIGKIKSGPEEDVVDDDLS